MMQFHSDFTFKLPNGKSLDAERVYSTDFWPIGKKLYCHALEGETEEGELVKSKQFKCKGCTHEGLLYKSREYGDTEDEGVFGLYMNLSMGETIEVPLNPPGQTRFVYDKDNRVSTHGKIFYRNIRSKAAQARVAAEQKAAVADRSMDTCCQQVELEEEEEEEEEEEDVFYDLPDSTRDSWRSSAAAMMMTMDSKSLSPRLQASQTLVEPSQGSVGSCHLGSEPQQFDVDAV